MRSDFPRGELGGLRAIEIADNVVQHVHVVQAFFVCGVFVGDRRAARAVGGVRRVLRSLEIGDKVVNGFDKRERQTAPDKNRFVGNRLRRDGAASFNNSVSSIPAGGG